MSETTSKDTISKDIYNVLTSAVHEAPNKSKKEYSKVCTYWINNNCYRTNCERKHFIDGLYKKSICCYWEKGKCNLGSKWCTYAHGEHDMYRDHHYYKSRHRSRSRSRDKLKFYY